jgi:phage gp29-like protein
MGILDRIRANFLAAAPVAVPQPLYRQVAVHRLFDWLAGIPDPDEVLRRTGRTRADLRQLLRDAEISQTIDTRREAVLATPWRFEGGTSRAGKFLQTELEPHIPGMVSGAWDAVLYGYSVAEVVYAKRGSMVGIDNIHIPPFEWFRPLPDGTLRYFPETGAGGASGIECDPRKFILTARNADYRNPYGQSMLAVLYWPVTWRLQGWQLWLNFLETFGAPIVVGKTGSYQQFVDAMQAQGVTRTVGWQPTGTNDEITTITASAPGEFERLESALDRCIQRVVLGQTLTSDVGTSGSYAAAKVHNEVRDDKRRADVRMIVSSVQTIVDSIWALNAFPGEPPEFVMQDDVGLERERADRDAVLAEKLGVRFTQSYLTERYDLEEEDFTIVDPTPQPIIPGAPTDPTADTPSEPAPPKESLTALLAAGPKFTPEQQVIEAGIASVLGDFGDAIVDAEIKAVVRLATSPVDLVERLAVLLKDKQSPEFQRVLERALFAADIIGYAHAA